MADQSDDVKPWTIKGVAPEARNAAISAAGRDKVTIGEWLARAILAQVKSDREGTRLPVVVGPPVRPMADLAEIERVVAMTSQLAGAGAPPPKALSRAAYGLLKEALAGMKGPTEGRRGPTKKVFGPTGEASGPTETTNGQTEAGVGQTEAP